MRRWPSRCSGTVCQNAGSSDQPIGAVRGQIAHNPNLPGPGRQEPQDDDRDLGSGSAGSRTAAGGRSRLERRRSWTRRPWDRASTLRSPLPQLRVSSGRTPRCGSVAVHDPDGGSRAKRLRRIGITNLSFPTLRISQLMIVLELPIRRRRGREQKRRDTLRDQLIDHLTQAGLQHVHDIPPNHH